MNPLRPNLLRIPSAFLGEESSNSECSNSPRQLPSHLSGRQTHEHSPSVVIKQSPHHYGGLLGSLAFNNNEDCNRTRQLSQAKLFCMQCNRPTATNFAVRPAGTWGWLWKLICALRCCQESSFCSSGEETVVSCARCEAVIAVIR